MSLFDLRCAGMNIYAAIFLIPFSVVAYTTSGGLKVFPRTFVLPASFAALLKQVVLRAVNFCFVICAHGHHLRCTTDILVS